MTLRTAACEIAATRAGHRAFVAVYPPLPNKNIEKWRVRKFEIPGGILEQNFGEEDLVDSHFLRLDTLEQVEEALAAWNVDSAKLDAPWKSDYPL
ncbi:MAG: hypothetical protein U0Q16_11030 [Bryobacteraceae bacterium]